ncbi:diguanylate cyclase [Thalassospira marina]|uniref:diguanylate cyclase n=1 Tax=Thalassospira marina TaxID=2048283 RepID=A0ABN5F9S6_9PROT|nr:diguanylate cyclase [Thalassospira marina]AUG51443.1 diguanylate cyclase response regulator [Thalassospira marina]
MNDPEGGRILIVDDDPIIIRILASALDHYDVLMFAKSGAEALNMIRQYEFDVILLDASLPDTDGFDVCRQLQARPIASEARVIFITGRTNADDETRALNSGAVDFIRKPVNVEVVQARVRTHLSLKLATDRLRRQSRVDGLTGVSNRLELETALRREWQTARRLQRPVSLVFFDIDFFKKLNDSQGHRMGDQHLQTVAKLLASAAKRGNDLVARYGGEEFVLLLPGAPMQWAASVAENLLAELAAMKLPHHESPYGFVTMSAGVASEVPTDENYERLVEQADQALYRAKNNRRNMVVKFGS